MEKERIIFHIDCNAFYASVEETLHPELKRVPMAVCGNPESRRGIILAKNELAKRFGVKTAETIWQAKQKCPELTLAPARHVLYRDYSERVNAIYEQYTDQVERFGIDESYLDVTGSLHLFGGDAVALAHQIRERVPEETKLTVSVGISFNKTFAKVASDMKKPNAVSLISRKNYRNVLWPMPASVLMMVGRNTEQALYDIGVRTVGDLANADEALLQKRLGKLGEQLRLYANGLDDSPVLRMDESVPLHSIGNGMTFKRDLVSYRDIHTAVTALADSVSARLRRHGMKCRTVQVTIKDTSLRVITRQKPAHSPTWLAGDLMRESMALISASWKIGVPIRMLTITGQKLVNAEEAVEQVDLFLKEEDEEKRRKQERLAEAVDGIRLRYGKRSISPASVVKNDLGIQEDYGRQWLERPEKGPEGE